MDKRIHLVSANSKNIYGMEAFVKKAFISLGYEVLCTDYRIMSKEEVSTRIRYITDAEFLLCVKGERVCPEDIFTCRIPTILWMQDSIQANQEANFVIQTKAPLFDIVYSFDDYELPFYKKYNKNSYFLPLAADVDTHKKVDVEKMINVGFVGNLNNNRINMINHLLDKGIPVQYSYSMDKYAEIVSKTKINFNIGITPYGNQQRIFEILAMGGFLLTNKLQGGTELFKNKEHLVYYENLDHLVELCYYYSEHEDGAFEIAKKGREEVESKHTYIHRAQTIIGDINVRRT